MSVRTKQALAVVAGFIVAGVMVFLGLWQMSSYQESTRDVSSERLAEPATPLVDAIGEDGEIADIYGKRVTFTGQYAPEHQVLVGGTGPLRVVTAFQLDDGRNLALVRGAIDSTAVEQPIPAPPPGPQHVEGVFLASDMTSVPSPDSPADLPSLRLQELAQGWPAPLIAGYVTLSPEDAQAQGLSEAPLVLPSGEGSATNRGYALQWWVFAGAAIAFGIFTARQLGKSPVKK